MKEKLKLIISAICAVGLSAVPVFANSTPDVPGAMTTAVTTIASDALGGLSSIIPVAAPIMGGLLIITVGVRTFRKFTKG